MNEIAIIQRPGYVGCDFEGLKHQIESYTKPYENVVFTEDTKTDAKKTVAEIRKSRKDFESRVKEAKAMYMKPWETFAEECNEIYNLYDKPIVQINEQIDAFEESRKKEKDERVKEIFGEMVDEPEILQFLPLNKIYNEKWLNATYTDKQIKDDIFLAKQNVKSGLATIKSFESDVEAKALQIFKETLQLPEALKVITEYEANKKVFKNKVETEARAEAVESFIPVEGGKVKCYLYNIFLTADAKQKLEAFMDSVGIEYRETEDEGGFNV